MASAPSNPIDVPPYQVQPLISNVLGTNGSDPSDAATFSVEVKCSQALGSEIYVGCTNGDLLRFALQANSPDEPESYGLLLRRTVSTGKPIDEIVVAPSISKAFVLSDRQIFFYSIPSLEPVPLIKPIRNVMSFAVDHQHIMRPAPPVDSPAPVLPVDFCVVKRTGIALYSLREQLLYQKEVPLPGGAFLARRIGRALCIADREQYSLVDLEAVTATAILPISQVPPEPGTRPHRPMIAHPLSISVDYPYTTALLPNQTIEVHNIETQEIAQVVPAPPLPSPDETSLAALLGAERRALVASPSGFLVPSRQQSEKLRITQVNLLGRSTKPGGRETVTALPAENRQEAETSEALASEDSADQEEGQVIEIPVSATPYDV
ncbi:hypothetical protein BC834DRAFT_875574 [Gloeopeniophorella convolvens]|nr:hypothetical protein BC834DRAFT_875574 [Gloeopeniophorella convolvens]